jgi:hypothetical protein
MAHGGSTCRVASMRPTAQTIEPEGQRGITYLERAFWAEVGSLDIRARVEPLAGPARDAGRPFDPVAAMYLAEQTGVPLRHTGMWGVPLVGLGGLPGHRPGGGGPGPHRR